MIFTNTLLSSSFYNQVKVGSPFHVVVQVVDYDRVESEFELQSRC